jgi:hypothetical protein
MGFKGVDSGLPRPSLLAQLFYLSRPFRRLEVETRDYRLHPVLGGISSTRWNAYRRFSRGNSLLINRLKGRELSPSVVKVDGSYGGEKGLNVPEVYEYEIVSSGMMKLQEDGVLIGDSRRNRLKGSRADDVLVGEGGDDLIVGRGGEDILIGGKGADRFRFRARDRHGDLEADTIVDFQPEQGDRIEIGGSTHFVGLMGFSGRPGEVQAMVWMADLDLNPGYQGKIHPWMIQGLTLAIDDDGDQRPDGLIELPGFVEFQQGWITF